MLLTASDVTAHSSFMYTFQDAHGGGVKTLR